MEWTQDLTGKVAIVTGGAERVGATLSRALAAAGADLVVNSFGTDAAAAETAAAIEALGRRAVVVEADVSSPADCVQLVDAAREEFGRLDILVHNASSFVCRPFLELTPDDLERSLGVIVRGPLFLSQAAAPLLKEDGGGKIVAILGNALWEAWPEFVSHAVAKAGLARLIEVLSVVLAPDIQCLGLCPGQIMGSTAGENDALRSARGETPEDGFVAMPDGTRFPTGTADDLAAMLIDVCTAGSYLSGVLIPLDGAKSKL